MSPQNLIGLALSAMRAGLSLGQLIFPGVTPADVEKAVNTVGALFADWVNTEMWSQYRLNLAWDGQLHPTATGMRVALLRTFGDIGASLNWIVNVIIPDSVNTGRKYSHGQLGPLVTRVNGLKAQVSAINSTLASLAKFRRTVDSDLTYLINGVKGWLAFRKVPGQILIDWIAAPGLLSAKLTPSITPDIVAQLGRKGQRKTVDQLLRTLARYSPDVVLALDHAAVAVLNSGSY